MIVISVQKQIQNLTDTLTSFIDKTRVHLTHPTSRQAGKSGGREAGIHKNVSAAKRIQQILFYD